MTEETDTGLPKSERLSRAFDDWRSGGRPLTFQLAAQASQELRALRDRAEKAEANLLHTEAMLQAAQEMLSETGGDTMTPMQRRSAMRKERDAGYAQGVRDAAITGEQT
jgi:hypothetical protein